MFRRLERLIIGIQVYVLHITTRNPLSLGQTRQGEQEFLLNVAQAVSERRFCQR